MDRSVGEIRDQARQRQDEQVIKSDRVNVYIPRSKGVEGLVQRSDASCNQPPVAF